MRAPGKITSAWFYIDCVIFRNVGAAYREKGRNIRSQGRDDQESYSIIETFFLGDRSLFVALGGGEDFRGDHLIFRRTKGGSVVTENPKGGIAENFGRIQRGDHSDLFVK